MEIETEQDWHRGAAAHTDIPRYAPSGVPCGVPAFLAWLMIWFRVCVVGAPRIVSSSEWWAAPRRYQLNRQRRRMGRVRLSRVRYCGANYILAGRHLTPRQFTEWQARYSLRGRINVYRMPYWRKTVKGKACPLDTEHDYWRDPPEAIGKHLSKLSCGIWAGHLWPGWWRLIFPHICLTSENHIGWAILPVRISKISDI